VRTGILGGTFDPIHIAHLHAGECALHQAGLDRVLFVPAGNPWQKEGVSISPGLHRLAMTELATEGVEGFAADPRELDRVGTTYTIDTLAGFPPDEELVLILGADAALGIPTWHRSEEVLERAQVLVAPRPGTDSTAVAAMIPDASFLDMAVLEVSGTEIRAMAAAGDPYRFLVTERVYHYIEEHRLYTEPDNNDMVGDSSETEGPP
jgi:nicotinate-nucleotide adenylyltransferase